MEKKVCYFSVIGPNHRNYLVEGNENTTLDTVWASQRSFFMRGSKVTITDEKGNQKIYTA